MFRNRRVPNGTHGGVRGRLEVKLQSLYSIVYIIILINIGDLVVKALYQDIKNRLDGKYMLNK